MRVYPSGEEHCIACKLCEAVCPLAITIDSDECVDGTRRTIRYDIDLFKCIWCRYCEESCPTDAIVLKHLPEVRMETRAKSILTKEMLLTLGERYEAKIDADNAADAPHR